MRLFATISFVTFVLHATAAIAATPTSTDPVADPAPAPVSTSATPPVANDGGPQTVPDNAPAKDTPKQTTANPTVPPDEYIPPAPSHIADSVTDGNSFAPILGYDPTYGVLLGLAFFHGNTSTPVTSGNLVATGTFHGNYALIGKYKLWTEESWYVAMEVGATHFFDAYYGEGDQTKPGNQIKIRNYKTYGIPALGYRFNDYRTLVISSELRYRHETGVGDDKTARVFGNEFAPTLDAAFVYDDRDNRDDTRKGTYLQSKLYFGPKALNTRKEAENFLKILIELRQFFSLSDAVALAFHLQGGTSLGEPGYQYRFDLGGANDMRGYQSNRLRGRHFYESQNELRVQALRWLGLVAFADIGDTADVKFSDFHGAKLTKGGGFRIGLPPDYVAKARFDFGIAPDEKNFYLSFNEAF